MRYTDRDCWAAMVRLAKIEGGVGVMLPEPRRKGDWREELRVFAKTLGVPVRHYSEDSGPTYYLEHRAGCYGGGVRPTLYHSGRSGQYTPFWWRVSAGLGPGAKDRRSFVEIAEAASEGMSHASQREEVASR